MAVLGLQPSAGALKGDVGVIYSNATGSRNELRCCWSNKSTGIIMGVPDESAFHVDRWGTVIVK